MHSLTRTYLAPARGMRQRFSMPLIFGESRDVAFVSDTTTQSIQFVTTTGQFPSHERHSSLRNFGIMRSGPLIDIGIREIPELGWKTYRRDNNRALTNRALTNRALTNRALTNRPPSPQIRFPRKIHPQALRRRMPPGSCVILIWRGSEVGCGRIG